LSNHDIARTGVTGAAANKLTCLSVEYSLTEHCNISCHACAHASPLLPEKFASVADFTRDLEALGAVFHASELRIVGGEPLLHPELLAFLHEGRRIGVADAVVVYTNGVLLHRMPDAFWRTIDELRVSIYPGVHRRLDEDACRRLATTHGVRLLFERYETFAQTLIGKRINDPALVRSIYRACGVATECHTVHDGRFYKCPMAPVMRSWLALHGTSYDSPPTDSVALHGNRHLRETLARYLDDRRPLAACSYCLGSSGQAVRHRKLNRAGCQAWLEEDSQVLIDAVRASHRPVNGVRRMAQLAKAALQKAGARRSER
jgi:hypothetical protein